MKLTIAAKTLAILRDVFIPRLLLADKHQHELDEAINLGISALKTIEDGNFMLKPTHYHPQIDIKTLYEQMTMYCDLVGETKDGNKLIFEKYHQPDTPIDVNVYWENNHVIKMTFEIREGKGI